MKLSQLVNFYNELCKLSLEPIRGQFNQEAEKISHVITHQAIQLSEITKQLHTHERNIDQLFESYDQSLNDLKKEYKQLISEAEKPWFAESYRLYDQEMQNETVEDIKNRTTTNISEDTKNFYLVRLSKYNSWKHAAMAIRPGFEPYVNYMVGCDPLYVVDVKHELLAPAISQYNENYQQRLRPYVVSEREDAEILHSLPNEQFGFIFAYNFFNFRPFEIIRRYLQEAYKKLQPGGVIVMTFNDCDRDKAVILVEQHFCCYTPGYLVLDLVKSIGFEPVLVWHDGGPSTWLELKKPGDFVSIRGGQSLAKIIPK